MDDSKVDGDDDVEVKDETDVDDVDLHQVRVGHHVLARVGVLLVGPGHGVLVLLRPEEEHPLVQLDRLRGEIDDHVLAVIKQLLCRHLSHEPEGQTPSGRKMFILSQQCVPCLLT